MAFTVQYGIPANPYETEELKPLLISEHFKLLDQVSQCVKAYQAMQDVKAHIALHANNKAPLFYLVKGLGGCGRSSVAPWILALYREQRKIPAANFIAIDRRTFNSNDPIDFLYEVTGLLISDIRRKAIPGIDIKSLSDMRSEAKNNRDVVTFSDLLETIAAQLDPDNPPPGRPPYGFGICISDVRVPEIVRDVFTAFSHAAAACVLSVGEYDGEPKKVIDFFEGYKDQAIIKASVPLPVLNGSDVREMVMTRWNFTTQHQPLPFPPDLEAAFSDKSRPVKRIVVLMNALLQIKANEYREKRWDHDRELGYDLQGLKDAISTLDQTS